MTFFRKEQTRLSILVYLVRLFILKSILLMLTFHQMEEGAANLNGAPPPPPLPSIGSSGKDVH